MNFLQKSFSFIFFAHGWARSDVKERVVWVDTTKTKVKDKEGKLKEKETTVLEVLGDNSGCCLTTGWQSLLTNFFFFPSLGESESSEAGRQTAPGGPLQH